MSGRYTAIALALLQGFVAVGALGGGGLLLFDPTGNRLGLPLYVLDGTPFSDFLIPAIVLFTVHGCGQALAAYFSAIRRRYHAELALLLGAALVGWIVVQIFMIGFTPFFHVTYLASGLVELALAWRLRLLRGRSG